MPLNMALVRPHLEFSEKPWSPTAQDNKCKLQQIQRRTSRIARGSIEKLSNVSLIVLRKANVLKLGVFVALQDKTADLPQ